MAPTSFCCSISSGIYVVTAEAETGCPRPPARFPRWRVRDACSGNRAPGAATLAAIMFPSWAAEPSSDSAFPATAASQPGCASSAVFPAGARVTPPAAAVLPDPARPCCNRATRSGRGGGGRAPGNIESGHGAGVRIHWRRGTPPKLSVSESGPGGASVAGVGLFPGASVLAACSTPDSALCWPPLGAGR
jgi:hypothetical protein